MKKYFLMLFLLVSLAVNAQTDTAAYCTVTYYQLRGRTASGETVHSGGTAISPDLLKKFPMGSIIEVKGYGRFTVNDKTSSRHRNWIDIWRPSKGDFRNGKNVKVTLISTKKNKLKS